MSFTLNKIPCRLPRVLLEVNVPETDDRRLFALYPNTCTFHSLTLAVPMNIVAHDVAISLYPKATFGLGINCTKFDDHHAAVTGRSKYTGRGWNLFFDSSAAASAGLCDVETYTLAIDTAGL